MELFTSASKASKPYYGFVQIRLSGIRKAIKPKDWKKRSAVKLPRKPRKFLISVFSGKIKLGSSGEKLIKEISIFLESSIMYFIKSGWCPSRLSLIRPQLRVAKMRS